MNSVSFRSRDEVSQHRGLNYTASPTVKRTRTRGACSLTNKRRETPEDTTPRTVFGLAHPWLMRFWSIDPQNPSSSGSSDIRKFHEFYPRYKREVYNERRSMSLSKYTNPPCGNTSAMSMNLNHVRTFDPSKQRAWSTFRCWSFPLSFQRVGGRSTMGEQLSEMRRR